MPSLPTSNERIDTVLTLARTKAAAHADDGDPQKAYKALLRGVQSAQRANSRGRTGTVLRGLWAIPTVKAVVLGVAPALIAAVTRSKSKSGGASDAYASDTSNSSPDDESKSSLDPAIPQQRKRFRRRPRTGEYVTVEDETKVDA